jgi:hypothetical protein
MDKEYLIWSFLSKTIQSNKYRREVEEFYQYFHTWKSLAIKIHLKRILIEENSSILHLSRPGFETHTLT